jgi:hypothetical protein
MRKLISCLVGAVAVQTSAFAFTDALPNQQVVDTRPAASGPTLPTVEGALSWSVLDQFREIADANAIPVALSATMRSLERSEVKVAGYMVPIEGTSGQSHFFLAATPEPCDFGFPGDLPTLIEVKTRSPITFTGEAIVLSGTFERSGEGRSVKYSLDGASLVPAM